MQNCYFYHLTPEKVLF